MSHKSSTATRSSHYNNRPSNVSNNPSRARQSLNPDQKSPSNAVNYEKKIVGHYVLGKTIGEGTFGKVQLAVHLPTGEKVLN